MYYAVTFIYTLPTSSSQIIRLQRTLPVKAHSENSAKEKTEDYIRSTIVKLYDSDFTITEVKELTSWTAFQKIIDEVSYIKKLD